MYFRGWREWAALPSDDQWFSCSSAKYSVIYSRATEGMYTRFIRFYLVSFPVLCDSSCSLALIVIFCIAAESLWCDDKVLVSRPLAPAVIHGQCAGHTLTTWLVCPIHLSSSHTAKDSSAAIICLEDEGRGCTSVMHLLIKVWLYWTVL